MKIRFEACDISLINVLRYILFYFIYLYLLCIYYLYKYYYVCSIHIICIILLYRMSQRKVSTKFIMRFSDL